MHGIFAQLPQQLINGLMLGSVYALLALGYSIVYGILRMLNFAHGDIFMVGSLIGWAVLQLFINGGAVLASPSLVLLLMVCGAVVVTSLLGGAIERFAYRPVQEGSRLTTLISALGASIVLQNIAMLMTQGRAKAYQTELIIPHDWAISAFGATVSATRLIIFCVSIGLMLAMDYAINHTMLGKAMRATSQDREAAEYMGIRTQQVIMAAFIIGSGLAGIAGVMIGLYYTQVDFMIGFSAGMKAFTAAVLGGIGNVRGAMAGGLVLGLAESLGVLFLAPVYKDVIVFSVLIAVLILRPQGILGKPVEEKV
ncbi:MAG TPA: branched-chain amino acid ABC transporter permease [Bacillota bacterium]|jgi:branched-chain amino acid transport system permease protein|nr:branched-chain amino acid ABC transporter permease [Bacillota bacterium]